MTNANDLSTANYIDRLEKIRRLSSPSLEGIDDAKLYSDLLRQNFIRIGSLSAENRAYLDTELFPVLFSQCPLSPAQTDGLIALSEALLSATSVENLDLPIASLISRRLLKDASAHDDAAATIRCLDMRMDACYALTLMLGRVKACPQIAGRFRQEGLAIGHRFLEYLEPERFRLLDDESRRIAVTDARYMAVFYEDVPCDEADPNPELALLERMLGLAGDPFYRQLMPDYDWRYFRYRVLDYYAKVTDNGNARGFAGKDLDAICDRTEELSRLWHSDATFSDYDSESQVQMLLCRNRCLAGRIDRREYLDTLIALYGQRDPDRYDLNGIYDNLQLPLEAMCLLNRDRLDPGDARRLVLFYREMIRYAFHMPNSGSLSTMLEYCQGIINRFIEVPGGLSFEEMALQCLAALHPPTYVHSVMVAKLSAYLCGRLIDRDPKWLVGAPGCESAEEVVQNRAALVDFTFHAARCHDVGKLSIIDTIFVYGRDLFDTEFELIRSHPRTGYELLGRYDSTRSYRDVALGHHRWYDNTRGYPEDFDTTRSPVKPIIDIVLCADCLDAATDSVGRSYRRGKTLEDFIAEVLPECGTHYPAWLAELLNDADTVRGLGELLQEGRGETYRNTYGLLRQMNDA